MDDEERCAATVKGEPCTQDPVWLIQHPEVMAQMRVACRFHLHTTLLAFTPAVGMRVKVQRIA